MASRQSNLVVQVLQAWHRCLKATTALRGLTVTRSTGTNTSACPTSRLRVRTLRSRTTKAFFTSMARAPSRAAAWVC